MMLRKVSCQTAASALFRSAGLAHTRLPRVSYLAMIVAGVAALAALALLFSENRIIALVFMGAIAFWFVLLRGVSLRSLLPIARRRFLGRMICSANDWLILNLLAAYVSL